MILCRRNRNEKTQLTILCDRRSADERDAGVGASASGCRSRRDSSAGLKAIAAGIGFAIAVFGGALGQSRIGAAACEGAARNPGAAAKIQTMMILGLALIESLVLFALVIVFVKT